MVKMVPTIEVLNTGAGTLRDLLSFVPAAAARGMSLPLGFRDTGQPVVADLWEHPHLLVAGNFRDAMYLHALVISFVCQEDIEFSIIDDARGSLNIFSELPQLPEPLAQGRQAAESLLNRAVLDMDARYRAIAEKQCMDIEAYNRHVPETEKLPHRIVVVSELAEIMSQTVETALIKLFQMGRAVGFHVICGTAIPADDVLTGLLRANLTSSIAFRVGSREESFIAISEGGAEQLTEPGDMIVRISSDVLRLRAPIISPEEIVRAVETLADGQ